MTIRHERVSGWLLLATGITHSVIGLVAGRAALAGMASDGFWMAALASGDRQRVIWFLMAGCMFLLSGCLALQFGRPLPASFGWLLGAVAVFGAVTFGPSGFFLVIPQALYILIVCRAYSQGRKLLLGRRRGDGSVDHGQRGGR